MWLVVRGLLCVLTSRYQTAIMSFASPSPRVWQSATINGYEYGHGYGCGYMGMGWGTGLGMGIGGGMGMGMGMGKGLHPGRVSEPPFPPIP